MTVDKDVDSAFNGQAGVAPTPVWLDCDPGHDDAFAILLTGQAPALSMLGVSTVHGNSNVQNTTANCLSLLDAIGRSDVPVFAGAARPLVRDPVYAAAVHGSTGLDSSFPLNQSTRPARTDMSAVDAMHGALMATPPQSAFLVATGALTNIALLVAAHPDVVGHIKGLAVMGGAVGGLFTNALLGKGSRDGNGTVEIISVSPSGGWPDLVDRPTEVRMSEESQEPTADVVGQLVQAGLVGRDPADVEEAGRMVNRLRRQFGNFRQMAEFNVAVDPEAAARVFSHPGLAGKTTLIPIDLTHQVIATDTILAMVLGTDRQDGFQMRRLFHDLLVFFRDMYVAEFGLHAGPPIHDPVAVLAVLAPDVFSDRHGERFEVDVVVSGPAESIGRTMLRPTLPGRPGIRIPRGVNTDFVWRLIDRALSRASAVSPLDQKM